MRESHVLRRVRHAGVLAAVALVCGTSTARADEIWLADGNRHSGTVSELDGGTLVFVSTYGTLRIPWDQVVRLAIDEPLAVQVANTEATTAMLADTGADGTTALVPGGPVALADIVALTRPVPDWMHDGGVNAGFLSSTGNTSAHSLRLDGELVTRGARDRVTTRAVFNRATDHGVATAENWTASGRYDRFVSERLYLDASAILNGDAFRDLDLRTALGLGVGYDVLTGGRARLSLEGGYGLVDERFDGSPDDRYGALRESTGAELDIAGRRLVAFHQHDGYFGVSGTDNLFVNTLTGLRAGLVGGLVATLQYDFDYDRSPAPDRGTTDRSLSLTFGYRF
jgi:putative salt-induced outer membrane protein YdiY